VCGFSGQVSSVTARHRDRGRVRFDSGALRLEADRRHLTLPVIGKLRSKENTRRLERLLAKGRAGCCR
jgi:putative transposase